FIGKKYISILKQLIETCAIFLRIIEYRRTHAHLDIPSEGFDLRIARSPDIEHVRAVKGHVSAHPGSRDHVSHSQCADTSERKIIARLERNGLTLSNLLHRDQRHFRENVSVLRLA